MIPGQAGAVSNTSNCDEEGGPLPRCCVSTPVMVMGLLSCFPQLTSLALWSLPQVRPVFGLFFRARSGFELVLVGTVGGAYCLQRRDYKAYVHHVLHAVAMGALHGSCLSTLALVLLKFLEISRPRLFASIVTDRTCLCFCAAAVLSSAGVGAVVYASFSYSPEPVWFIETPIHVAYFTLPWTATLVFNGLLTKVLFEQFGSMCNDLTDAEASLKRSVFVCVVATSFVSFLVYPFLVILFAYGDKCVSEIQINTRVLISWINFGLYLFLVEMFRKTLCH